MALFSRKKTLNTGYYVGPVVFVEGFHYPVGPDGHRAGEQPLVVEIIDGREAFAWGTPESPKHNHVYERRVVEVVPFSEDPVG